MREESGSEEDSDEPVEWEDDDEVSSEEDGSENEVRVSNAQRGRVRFHRASQSSTGLEVDDERSKSFMGEKGWARRAVVVRGVEPSGAADFEAVPALGARSTTWARTAQKHHYFGAYLRLGCPRYYKRRSERRPFSVRKTSQGWDSGALR